MSKLFTLLGLFLSGASAFAAPLDSALKITHEPGYFSVFISLIFVICLVYVTGIAYNKLNNLGIKTLKAQNKNFAEDKITIISTTPLGTNKTLHVVELNGKKMLIGASTNSIHLIKDLSESQTTSEDFFVENNTETDNNENSQKETKEDNEDFGLYKKYLR